MTTDEMVHAFRLRARGKTYDEIGELMNYEGHTINDTLSSVIHGRRHVKVVVSKNHPKLAKHINDHYDGVIRRFAARCKLSSSAIQNTLRGRGSKETHKRIQEVAGNVL